MSNKTDRVSENFHIGGKYSQRAKALFWVVTVIIAVSTYMSILQKRPFSACLGFLALTANFVCRGNVTALEKQRDRKLLAQKKQIEALQQPAPAPKTTLGDQLRIKGGESTGSPELPNLWNNDEE